MKHLFFLLGIVSICSPAPGQNRSVQPIDNYVRALKDATDIMVTDVASPVAAARYYSYITLAAQETVSLFNHDQPRFAGFLPGLQPTPVEQALPLRSDLEFSTILALYQSASRLLPSGPLLHKNIDSLSKLASKTLTASKIEASKELVARVVDNVMKYAAEDGFFKLSGMRRFTPKFGDAYWQPTAPGFMAPIEPHWSMLRTFFLDSCTQFASPPPVGYNPDSTSRFYHDLVEVYDVVKHLSHEQADIAMFWDCNPFALQQIGHLEFGIKKLSPGGHWIGITGIACKQDKRSLAETAYAHVMVSLGLQDAFIACWDGKYRYNRVRPVTAIHKLIDKTWSPLLQTPPFPEYTSGHSVISTTAATILTSLFGEKFSFTDDTEVEFGLPTRSFPSFIEASSEAAISRLYGGIHFRDAIDNGVEEGGKIGQFIVAHSPHRKDGDNTTHTFSVRSRKHHQ